MYERPLLSSNQVARICTVVFLLAVSTQSLARVSIAAAEPGIVQSSALGNAGASNTNSILSARCISSSMMELASYSVRVVSGSNTVSREVVCDSTEYTFPLTNTGSGNIPNYRGTAQLTVTNETMLTGSVEFQVKGYGIAWPQANRETLQIPAARSCTFSLPAAVNLGSFTVDQIGSGVASNQKINLVSECNTGFSITLSGNTTPQADFMLGSDIAMMLSYNYGANRIINGLAFTPGANQIIDISLSSAVPGITPSAGTKNITLTATVNLL